MLYSGDLSECLQCIVVKAEEILLTTYYHELGSSVLAIQRVRFLYLRRLQIRKQVSGPASPGLIAITVRI